MQGGKRNVTVDVSLHPRKWRHTITLFYAERGDVEMKEAAEQSIRSLLKKPYSALNSFK